jgi:succinate dehydrogenase/fumarate reductase flavoprotein subunit
MESEKGSKKGFSRRDFIKTTAAGVGGAALTGLSPEEARAEGRPEKWDRETDVVIVGCGGAGTTAAITAHDAGAEVIIVEKAPEGGGNSRVGGGQFTYSTPEKKDDAARHLHAVCNGTTPMDVCQAWADEMVHNAEWLTSMGVTCRAPSVLTGGDYRQVPYSDSVGTGMFKALSWYETIEKQIKDRGIEILFNSPATELIRDCVSKEILGVSISSGGKDQAIKARKGVVLCSGGFEFNEEMKKNYLRPDTIKFTGWKYNTGDGVRMAQAVGADLWHMNMICSSLYTIVTPNSEMGWMYPEPKASNFILVSKYGERFMKEGEWFPHRSFMGYSLWDWRSDRKDSEYPCCPQYMIVDETTRLAGSIGSSDSSMLSGMGNTITPTWLGGTAPGWGEKGGGWSEDNSLEIEKGWIKKADTIGALADTIGGEMTPETLAATVEKWNGFCEAGVDSEFGRNDARGMSPRGLEKIETPPFYAIELWPGGFSTCGGPRKNAQGQVMDVFGKPIERLYEAGSLGHTCGQVYAISGANYCECFVWGRISGRNVAALKSWA